MFLTEPFSLQDIYISGLGRVEDLADGNMRLTGFVTRQGIAEAVVSVVMPLQAVKPAILMIAPHVGVQLVPVATIRAH